MSRKRPPEPGMLLPLLLGSQRPVNALTGGYRYQDVGYPINQAWELFCFHSKLEKTSDEVEDAKDDRPIDPASKRSTFWPRVIAL
jgi:hypothetical protein